MRAAFLCRAAPSYSYKQKLYLLSGHGQITINWVGGTGARTDTTWRKRVPLPLCFGCLITPFAPLSRTNPRQPVSADTCLWAAGAGHLLTVWTEDGGRNIASVNSESAGRPVHGRWRSHGPLSCSRKVGSDGCVSVPAVMCLRWAAAAPCALCRSLRAKGPSTKSSVCANWK